MKERPMIFNAEMVRAILDGRKTQTRRLVNPEPDSPQLLEARTAESGCVYAIHANRSNVHQGRFRWDCPFGKPGDRIWVRETWARYNIDQDSHDMAYRATTPEDWPEEGRWRPSIHMPRWASRITLEITGVRVERLQSISDEDVDAEGFAGDYPTSALPALFPGEPSDWSHLSMRDCYGVLWKSIYGEESWQSNPWVWVIEFKRIEGGAA